MNCEHCWHQNGIYLDGSLSVGNLTDLIGNDLRDRHAYICCKCGERGRRDYRKRQPEGHGPFAPQENVDFGIRPVPEKEPEVA